MYYVRSIDQTLSKSLETEINFLFSMGWGFYFGPKPSYETTHSSMVERSIYGHSSITRTLSKCFNFIAQLNFSYEMWLYIVAGRLAITNVCLLVHSIYIVLKHSWHFMRWISNECKSSKFDIENRLDSSWWFLFVNAFLRWLSLREVIDENRFVCIQK